MGLVYMRLILRDSLDTTTGLQDIFFLYEGTNNCYDLVLLVPEMQLTINEQWEL